MNDDNVFPIRWAVLHWNYDHLALYVLEPCHFSNLYIVKN